MQDIVDYLFEYVQEHRLAFYLNADPEYQNAGRMAERALFRRLVARNARNMNFERHRVVFAAEQDLEQIVREEVLAWEASC